MADGYTWPAGSGITIEVRSHDSHATYDLYFYGGKIGSVTTDEYGDADLDWIIPSGTAARESPPNTPMPLKVWPPVPPPPVIADTGIYVTTPQIVVPWRHILAGRHAIDGQPAPARPPATATRYAATAHRWDLSPHDSDGLSVATIFCTIPETAEDSPPYYTITSYDDGNLIGSVDVTVSTPDEPYCVIPGGYDWPGRLCHRHSLVQTRAKSSAQDMVRRLGGGPFDQHQQQRLCHHRLRHPHLGLHRLHLHGAILRPGF